MVIINTYSDKYFTIDGVRLAKIYQPLKQGSSAIGIYNIYDTRQQLLASIEFSQFIIDTVTYETQEETIAALLSVIYSAISESEFESYKNKVDNLQENQVTGVLPYETKAEVEALPPIILISYKVTNDPTPSNNGYWHYNGSILVQDEVLNQDLIDDLSNYTNTSIRKANGNNLITLGVSGKYLSSTGVEAVNALYNISDYIPIKSGDLLYKNTNYAGSSYTCYYDSSHVLIGTGINTQFIPYISGASYVRVSYSFDYSAVYKIANLIDYNDADVANGYYLSSGGVEVANSNYNISGYIPIQSGQVYYKGDTYGGGGYTCYYDNTKALIASTATNKQILPWISGASYIRVTYAYDDSVLYESELFMLLQYLKGTITTNAIKDGAVNKDKTSFYETINLYDKDNPGVIAGYYLADNGSLAANASYNVSHYIPVSEGDVFRKSLPYFSGAKSAFYDSSFTFITGSDENNGVIIAPENAAYLRVSVLASINDTYMLVKGNGIPNKYYAYGEKAILENNIQTQYANNLVNSLAGNDSVIRESSSITDGNSLSVYYFPQHIKKLNTMSFCAEISIFATNVIYGKGYLQYSGQYFKIDNTNVYLIHYNGSTETIIDTQAHGLTFNTFIKSSFTFENDGTVNFILQTLTDYFQTTFNTYIEMSYDAFIMTNGQTLSNVKLTIGNSDFKRPVWVFGDSYVSVADTRWTGVIKTFGYFNFMLNGLAGQRSDNAYIDFNKSLMYGTPKYLVWCLGMNDDDSSYEEYLNKIIAICNGLNITLILSTIPTVPARDKETIKTLVESSGYRYIDFYKAVGADSLGNWYSGYLYVDEVHPTELGAQALATQVLVDFPEIMQYGKI